jgi:two-component system, cell cycle sensor histidine kinase and response regulator CckA
MNTLLKRHRLIVVSLVAAACIFGVSIATFRVAHSYYESDRLAWIPLNRGNSESVRERIMAWATERFREASTLGLVLSRLASTNRPAADSAAASLSSPAAPGVWVVDAHGQVRVGRSGPSRITVPELDAARAVIASRSPTAVGPFRLSGSTRVVVSIITASSDSMAVVQRLDADSSLFQLSDWAQRTTETAQIVLVGMTSDSMFALTPLRLPASAPALYRRSMASVSPLWRAAARGVDTSGYFADERGVRVLASSLSLAPLPWSLIVQVDETEIMELTRRILRVGIALTATALALAFAATAATSRAKRMKRLRRTIDEEGRFRQIVSAAMDAIITTDCAGIVIDVNPAAAGLLGSERGTLLGTSLDHWFAAKSGDPSALISDIRRRGGESIPHLFCLRQEKDDRHVEVTGSASRWPTGAETITLFARDVTQRQRLEEAVRRTQEIALIGRVAGGLAHEFNNALLVVSGNAELLRDGAELRAPERESVEEVLDASRRLARLTSQLLSFGRQQMLRSESVDLVRFLADLEPMIRSELSSDRLVERSLIIRCAMPAAFVRIDRQRLAEAVLHLVSNARNAMMAAGQLTIEIGRTTNDVTDCAAAPSPEPSPRTESAEWRITFRDTGVGMPPEVLARARQPFFSTRSQAVAQGLGLAVVDGIAEQSGGRLELESAEGEGTTATIVLPSTEPTAGRSPGPDGATSKSPPERRRALVVDDDPAVRRVVARCLRSVGYETTEAADAEKGLDVVRAADGAFELVVSDLIMPGMDGSALRRRLLLEFPQVPVLLISGYSDDELARRGLSDPTAAFLQKPFTREDIARAVDALGLKNMDTVASNAA